MNKFHALMGAAALALVAMASSCFQATDTKAATPPATVSPRVLTLSWTGDGGWYDTSFGFYPLAGKTITQASLTYAVTAPVLTGLGGEWDIKNSGVAATKLADLSWTAPGDFPAASTWITITSLATSATDNIGLKVWNNGTGASTVYLKQIDLTYSDATVETLTFVSDAQAPVKSVITGGATSYVPYANRVWGYSTKLAANFTPGYEAAPF